MLIYCFNQYSKVDKMKDIDDFQKGTITDRRK